MITPRQQSQRVHSLEHGAGYQHWCSPSSLVNHRCFCSENFPQAQQPRGCISEDRNHKPWRGKSIALFLTQSPGQEGVQIQTQLTTTGECIHAPLSQVISRLEYSRLEWKLYQWYNRVIVAKFLSTWIKILWRYEIWPIPVMHFSHTLSSYGMWCVSCVCWKLTGPEWNPDLITTPCSALGKEMVTGERQGNCIHLSEEMILRSKWHYCTLS